MHVPAELLQFIFRFALTPFNIIMCKLSEVYDYTLFRAPVFFERWQLAWMPWMAFNTFYMPTPFMIYGVALMFIFVLYFNAMFNCVTAEFVIRLQFLGGEAVAVVVFAVNWGQKGGRLLHQSPADNGVGSGTAYCLVTQHLASEKVQRLGNNTQPGLRMQLCSSRVCYKTAFASSAMSMLYLCAAVDRN